LDIKYIENIYSKPTEKKPFLNEKTNEEKLKMVREHLDDGKSLSHISEIHGGFDVGRIKYLVNLFLRHGEEIFTTREEGVYKRDSKYTEDCAKFVVR